MSCLSKDAHFNLPHLHLAPRLGVTPFKFCGDFRHKKTSIPWLSWGVVCVILHLAISVEHRFVTDRQTHDYDMYQATMESCVENDAFGVKQNLSPSSLKDCCVNYKAAILQQLIHRHKTNARSYKHNTLTAIVHVNLA